jgi:aryl sulfotransferase
VTEHSASTTSAPFQERTVFSPAAERRRYANYLSDSARWDDFRFRDDDIVICTPAKCGTTWMQMICALLIFQGAALPGRLDELSPWLDSKSESLDQVIAALETQENRRFIKTHTPLDGLPYDERVTYLCVGRDPRDVAVSAYHHRQNMNRPTVLAALEATGGLEDFPEYRTESPRSLPDNPTEGFWAWVEAEPAPEREHSVGQSSVEWGGSLVALLNHLATFWERRHLANVVLFHYSDLHADLGGQMRNVASVLGIDVEEGLWPELVTAARFENMKARAGELVPEVHVEGFWLDTSRFFNKGSSGQWRQIMSTVEDQRRYQARVGELGSAELLGWAHGGSLVPGTT